MGDLKGLSFALILAVGAVMHAAFADVAPSDTPTWGRYEVLAYKLRLGRSVQWWHGLAGSWEVEGEPFAAAGPALAGRIEAKQLFKLRSGMEGTLLLTAERDLIHSEWLKRRIEAELRVRASPIWGLAVKLDPRAWSEDDLRHLRATVRSSLALKIWGPVVLAAQLDSEYDRFQRRWEHSPTVGLQVESKEFNWRLPKF